MMIQFPDNLPENISFGIVSAIKQAVREGGYSTAAKCRVQPCGVSVWSWLLDLKLMNRNGTLTEKGFSEGCRLLS